MVIYLSIISVFLIILFMLNIFAQLTIYTPLVTFLLIIGITVFQVAVDGFFALVVHLLPNKWFGIENRLYKVSNKERKFYEKLKIRLWKDKILELGSLGGFSKKSLKSSSDKEYIMQFIIESNKGVLTHIIGCFAGFIALFIFPIGCAFNITIPICIINFILNLPSLFILRYNTPKLHAGYKRLCRNELNSKNTEQNSNYEMVKNEN